MPMIYSIGLNLGLTVRDIDIMTSGEIIDLAYYRANQENDRKEKEERGRQASQADYDNF